MSDRYQWDVDLRTPYTELERYQQDRLMRIVIRAVLVIAVVLLLPYGYAAIRSSTWHGIVINIMQILLVADVYLAWRQLKRGFIQRAAYTLIPYLMFVIVANGLITDSIYAVAPALLSLIVVSGIVLGSQGNLMVAGVAFIMWITAIIVDQLGWMPPSPLPPVVSSGVFLALTAVSFFFIAVIGYDASRRLQQALGDANYQLVESNVKLEEANRLKSQFTARTSHELRTPLNAIVVSADLMNRKLYGPITDDQIDALDRILRNTRRLQKLIDDILDLSKIEAGKLELVEKPFAVSTLVDTVRATLESKARTKGLQFFVTIAPDMPTTIIADEHRLTQILTNLTDNAIKFTDQGDVSVMIERGTFSHWKMIVKDTGRGIHEKEFDRVFEEFRRSETAGAVAGTGLGLPITKQLINLMKGNIYLRSQLSKGSTFEVVLPLKVPDEQPAAAQPAITQPDLSTVKLPG